MKDDIVLNAAIRTHDDREVRAVRSQDGSEPDARTCPDPDIPNEDCSRREEDLLADLGCLPIVGKEERHLSLRRSVWCGVS
jgi:hypothetical protein